MTPSSPATASRGSSTGIGGRIVRLVHPLHGEEQWLQIRSSDIEGADGRPIYTVSAFEDVTEMKFAEFAQEVFANIAEMLSTATDPEQMLERLVHLVIPRLADASAVLVPTADGTLKRPRSRTSTRIASASFVR